MSTEHKRHSELVGTVREALYELTPRGRINHPLRDPALAALAALEEQLEAARRRGWPNIEPSRYATSHSPVDSYRCDNEDCPQDRSVWQFRPDDHDLDETAINCPACGVEGELFFRWFRSDGSGEPMGTARSAELVARAARRLLDTYDEYGHSGAADEAADALETALAASSPAKEPS